MKKALYIGMTAGLLLLVGCGDDATKADGSVHYVTNPEIQAKGMGQIKGMLGKMKPTLKKALKADHTGMGGLIMCSSAAGEMGKKYNASLPEGSSIRRTALKYRNEKNKPDTTDIAVMQKLEKSRAFDKPLVVEMSDSFRIYKALPVKKACLTCHGIESEMFPMMKKFIEKKYPQDKAVNFKENDLRGVIISTIKK